jgi:hypothetical protein
LIVEHALSLAFREPIREKGTTVPNVPDRVLRSRDAVRIGIARRPVTG